MMKKALLVFSFGFYALSAFAEIQTPGRPHTLKIAVETRQTATQKQGMTDTTSTSAQSQFIVVTEGAEGRIFVGESVPQADYYYTFLMNEGYLTRFVKFRDVGTSLIVRARVQGDGQIEVTLTPEISYLTQSGRANIAVQTLSTSVVVPAGQPLEIGGSASRSEFENNFFRGSSGQSMQMVLTPTIIN